MTPGKPSPPDDRTPTGLKTSVGWTGQEKEIIFRTLSPQQRPAGDPDIAPAPRPSGARSIRLSPRRRRLDRGQIAVLAVFGLTLLIFLVGALTSTERNGTSVPQVATRSPAEASRAVAASSASSATAMLSERREASPSPAPAGEEVVRTFYDALGRGDGETASALVVAEKRSAQAFSPQAISRFYGGLRDPLRLTAISPLDDGAFRVTYRYSAGRSRCDGRAVVNLASRDGRDLIRSIRALNDC